jgi:hypothetical protein
MSTSKLKSFWETTEVEIPNQPSTRTGFSAKKFEQLHSWVAFQEQLKNKISKVRHVNILFYGDSITESLEGTSYGQPCTADNQQCRDIPGV